MAKKTILSPEQDAAATPTKNVWVQANAGTGKTSVLTQRLLRILFRTTDCLSSGILCLTYTNAGAGEMRNRILRALREWAMADDSDLIEMLDGIAINRPATQSDIMRAREIFFTYIDNPDLLKVKTIHGFCEEILHRFPLEAGISPSWSLVSDSAQRVLLQDSFSELINNGGQDTTVLPAFFHLVNRVSENYLDELLMELSEQYKNFFGIENIVNYREYFIDTIKDLLKLKNKKSYETTVEKLQNIIKCAQEEKESIKKPAKYFDTIINNTKKFIDNTIDFEEYKNTYLTSTGRIDSNLLKKDYLIDEAERVYELNQQNINQTIFDDTVAMFDLSAAFATEYKKIKRARNLLDFEDLILYTRKLFSNRATMGWVLSQLDLSLSHILVDEAQDTSPMQWDILRMLAGDFFTDGDTSDLPHSIFVVGDTKQSIYGFQGADPNAFATSKNEIYLQIQNNTRTIQEIPLTQSFRSTAPVLKAVDKFFSDEEVIKISNFSNAPHKCFRLSAPGAVEIHKLISKAATETTTQEYLQIIADKIQHILSNTQYKASDIMILLQQRHPMAIPLTNELKRRNITVAGSDRIKLPNFPAIRDFLNLIRWCLDSTDDFSLCCVLRSPFYAMNQGDIYNLCIARNTINTARSKESKDYTKTTVFEQLKDTHPELHTELSSFSEYAKKMGPYSFFSKIFEQNHTRQKFISALGTQVIDPIEEFMSICLAYERTQSGTLYQFLKWFITGGSEIKRDLDSAEGVRIVTVHGSKGLESPVVFLIDTTSTPKTEKTTPIPNHNLPVWLWAPRTDNSAIRAQLSEQLNQTRLEEYYRLLYVAMTRARDELYIYGYSTYKNANYTSWHSQLWRVFADTENSEHIRITNDTIA